MKKDISPNSVGSSDSAGVNLPPLPEPKYIYHNSPNEGEDDLYVFAESGAVDENCGLCERLYTAEQMHTYARAAVDRCQPHAALKAAEAEIRWWVDEHGCCRGHETPALDQITQALASLSSSSSSQPQPQDSVHSTTAGDKGPETRDAQDAARYRFIAANWGIYSLISSYTDYFIGHRRRDVPDSKAGLDAAIDAEMAGASPAGDGEKETLK